MYHIKTCIACGNEQFWDLGVKGHLFSIEHVQFCSHCGLVFLSPRLDSKELDMFYKSDSFSENYRGADAPNQEMVEYRDFRAARRISLLDRYLQDTHKRVLEIGCSCGSFIHKLKTRGFSVFGMDPSTGFVNYAKSQFKLNAEIGSYPQDKVSGHKYDIVACFHVFEHVHDPMLFLNNIHNDLLANGLLFLEIPDLRQVVKQRKIIRPCYFHKAHLWEFSKYNIRMILEKTGFIVRDIINDENRSFNKNMLIVAEKCEKRDVALQNNAKEAKSFYRKLRRKLFLGRMVERIDGKNNTNS